MVVAAAGATVMVVGEGRKCRYFDGEQHCEVEERQWPQPGVIWGGLSPILLVEAHCRNSTNAKI